MAKIKKAKSKSPKYKPGDHVYVLTGDNSYILAPVLCVHVEKPLMEVNVTYSVYGIPSQKYTEERLLKERPF